MCIRDSPDGAYFPGGHPIGQFDGLWERAVFHLAPQCRFAEWYGCWSVGMLGASDQIGYTDESAVGEQIKAALLVQDSVRGRMHLRHRGETGNLNS